MATGPTLPFDEPVWELDRRIEELRLSTALDAVAVNKEIRELERKRDEILSALYANLTPWQQVQLARHPNRPTTLDYVRMMVEDFVELHGDRRFGDDHAIVAGFGKLDGRRVVVIGHQKGRDTREKLRCNFGMPHPEGYRKALRVMRLAEKFHLPVVTLIDTPGAYPGVGAEERGEAAAIAENLLEMARLRTPIISVVTGEGCSGGAIGIGLADHLALLQYAYYSVISPEGCAAILWKTGEKAAEAAAAMRLTARDLLELGLIDAVIPEPIGGAHRNPEQMAATLKSAILKTLDALCGMPLDRLLEARTEKYRRVGVFMEQGRRIEQALAARAESEARAQKRAGRRRTLTAGSTSA